MKALLAFAIIFSTSMGFAGQLSIDVVPSHGGASYLQFTEANGRITSTGNGPFSGVHNQTYVEEKADGSFEGFVFGTPFHLVCSETGCVDNGSAQVNVKITKANGVVSYDGAIQYRAVHAVVSDTEINVMADGGFRAMKNKNGSFSGQGGFSRLRFGGFDVKLKTTDYDLNDPRLFVLTVLNTFTAK